MPFPKTWLFRLDEILAEVRRLESSCLEREDFMSIFRVKRRAALLLMKALDPQSIQGRWLVPKGEVIRWLESSRPVAEREISRRARCLPYHRLPRWSGPDPRPPQRSDH